MSAAIYHLQIEPGSELGFTATVTNPDGTLFDLTPFDLTAQARTPAGQLILDLSSYLGNGGSNGVITAIVPASATQSVPGQQSVDTIIGGWDLLATSGGTVYRLLQGQVHVIGRVTR